MPFHRSVQALGSRPLVCLALAMALGILLEDRLRPSPGLVLAVGFLAAGSRFAGALAGSLGILRSPPAASRGARATPGSRAAVHPLLPLFLFFCLGAGRAAQTRSARADLLDGLFGSNEGRDLARHDGIPHRDRIELLALEASVRGEAQPVSPGAFGHPRWSLDVQVLRLMPDGGPLEVSFPATLTAGAASPETLPHAGTRIRILASLTPAGRPPDRLDPALPGMGSPRAPVSIRASGPGSITILTPPHPLDPLAALARLRERLARGLRRRFPGEDGAILTALLLGRRRGVSDALLDAFSATGTSHTLSVSGLHAGLLAAAFLFLARRVGGLRQAAAAAATCLFLAGYAVLAGGRAPILRAAALFGGAVLAGPARRLADTANLLGGAALVLLSADPSLLFRLGFRLSFLGAGSLILLSRKVASRSGGAERARASLPRRIASAAAVSLEATTVAFLATAPVALPAFHRVALLAPIANLLVVPLIWLLLLAGVLELLVASLAPFAVGILLDPALRVLLELLRGILGMLASVPGMHPTLALHPLSPLLLTAAAGIFLAGRGRRRAAAVLPFVLALVSPLPVPRENRLELLSVGHGLCALAEHAASGEVLMYDVGAQGGGNRAAAAALRALWRRQRARPDVLILSHPDGDHRNGLGPLLRRCRPPRIRLGSYPDTWRRSPGAGRVLEELGAAVGIDWGFPSGAAGAVMPPWIHVLWPPRSSEAGGEETGAGAKDDLSDNDLSTVVLLELGPMRVLLAGDLEDAGIEGLLARGKDIHADVLVLPHHGSYRKGLEDLIDAVRPGWVLVPNGSWPSIEKTRRTLARRGLRCAETASCGTILVTARRGEGIRLLRGRDPADEEAGGAAGPGHPGGPGGPSRMEPGEPRAGTRKARPEARPAPAPPR